MFAGAVHVRVNVFCMPCWVSRAMIDSWEVTQTRKKFPEKVPFRFTRMLENAMELAGRDGAVSGAMLSSAPRLSLTLLL